MHFNAQSLSNKIDGCESQNEKHSEPRLSTFRGIVMDLSNECEKARGLIVRKREFFWKDTKEMDLQYEKQSDPRISTFRPIVTDESWPKYRSTILFEMSTRKLASTSNASFPRSTEIKRGVTFENAEPSIDMTVFGIVTRFTYE
jgi:hypothetical protein